MKGAIALNACACGACNAARARAAEAGSVHGCTPAAIEQPTNLLLRFLFPPSCLLSTQETTYGYLVRTRGGC